MSQEPTMFAKVTGGIIGASLIFAGVAGSLGLALLAAKFLFNVIRGF